MSYLRPTTLTAAILMCCAVKHMLHGLALILTTTADRNMTNIGLFRAFFFQRDLVIAVLFAGAIMAIIGALRPMSFKWMLVFMAPQQILLTLSCYGVFGAVWFGTTPGGVATDRAELFMRQLPLLTVGTIHFIALIDHARRAK